MRRYKRAIRGVALFTQQGNLSSTNNAHIFKALNTVNSGQLRILGSMQIAAKCRSRNRIAVTKKPITDAGWV